MSSGIKEEKSDIWIGRFRQAFERRKGGGSPWIESIREKAFSFFETHGLPTTKSEQYRFTSLAPLGKHDFVPSDGGALPASAAARIDSHRMGNEVAAEMVFVNGRFVEELSRTGDLPDGVVVTTLRRALAADRAEAKAHLARHAAPEKDPLTALNTALFEDGLFLHVPDGCRVELPVHAIFYSHSGDGTGVSFPRNLLLGGAGSGASVIETYAGGSEDGPYWTDAVTEAAIEKDAIMTHYKNQVESENSFHVATVSAKQESSSRFSSFSISFGAQIARNDIGIVMAGEKGNSCLNGLYVVDDDVLVDHHTRVDHAVPRCESDELYKGILMGRSRGVFNGKIFVHQDAQETSAMQSNRNLLLSDDAAINTQPQLEILADDVRCTHGATVGQLNEESLFYFRSRGIDKESARKMLIYAFAAEVVEKIEFEPLREKVGEMLYERLGSGQSLRGE